MLQALTGFFLYPHCSYNVATSQGVDTWLHERYDMAMPKQSKKVADNRDNVLRIRLKAAERQELDQAAQERSLDTSTWARMELIRLARGKK